MRTIQASAIGAAVEALCLEVSTELPPDVLEALESFREAEKSEPARQVIDLILENARVASRAGVPLCQDTGVFTVYVTLGRDTVIEGDLQAEASAAVARATARGPLRASIVSEPMDERRNTKDNTPALLELELSGPDDPNATTLGVLAKGGGSEMASRAAMLAPGAGWEGVMDFVLDAVSELGARSCPPLVLGVGVGGTFDSVAVMAKRGLMEPLDRTGADPRTAAREAELVAAVNGLGIGPGALGGTTTCIGAKIATAPCHMASLPVALSVNCHSLRRKVIEI
jgi:tartrate/fumarate subfamily iron-sulfur-dependent hydro-lyase alpha chain